MLNRLLLHFRQKGKKRHRSNSHAYIQMQDKKDKATAASMCTHTYMHHEPNVVVICLIYVIIPIKMWFSEAYDQNLFDKTIIKINYHFEFRLKMYFFDFFLYVKLQQITLQVSLLRLLLSNSRAFFLFVSQTLCRQQPQQHSFCVSFLVFLFVPCAFSDIVCVYVICCAGNITCSEIYSNVWCSSMFDSFNKA